MSMDMRASLAYLFWVVVLLLFWLLLTGGEAWISGLAVSLSAAGLAVQMGLRGPQRIRPLAAARFLIFFLQRSLAGGLDVAWRALHPAMPLSPNWLDYPLRLRHPGARALFIGTVSLTPGTLGADVSGNCARIHTILDGVEPDLRRLEAHVAALFGERLEDA
jgi:multicomponent Na+:H+ antiporter subunit E